jgi:tRNA-dihydrouridine synthase 1
VKVPVTVKIRILDTEEETLELVQRLEAAGAYILTVHGRTKEMKKDLVGAADWDIIKKIKETLSIPVFANGGIFTFGDVERCLAYTQCDGVMSSEALLENPALFCGEVKDMDGLAMEYIAFS